MWARCDEKGQLISEAGRVEIRYRPHDGKAYKAALRNLTVGEDDSRMADDAMGEAKPSGGRAGGRSGVHPRLAKKPSPSVPTPPSEAVIAYTDGACSGNPGPCGIGVVVRDGGQCRELSEYLGTGTNNIAELTAIGRALEAVNPVDRPMWVFTDSRYAIGVLTEGWRAKANLGLVAAVRRQLTELREVRLVYVPGHAGVELNERADALARAAIRERGTLGWAEAHALSE